ncbi:MAG TPA: NAD-dependent epimerase/dehydratase family protein [Candidatus Limnocylindrales bacterium]
MHVFVTGGAGFIGRTVVHELVARGDSIVAAVRNPARASDLEGSGLRIVKSDLSAVDELVEAMRGTDAVIHIAGMYRLGIPASEHAAMWDANVGATERVLDAAAAADVARIVVVSTVNVFGNTGGIVVDETYERDAAKGFLSYYDETKFRAFELTRRRAAAGRPIIIAMPGVVYGQGDYSTAGLQLHLAFQGKLRFRALDEVGMALVHVDDVARGIIACLDRGGLGEAYALTGEPVTLRDAIAVAAAVGGRRTPRLRIPTTLLRASAPFGPLLSRIGGTRPNLGELVCASSGVTYWVSNSKATRELGFYARSVQTGVRDSWGHD